MHDEPNRRLWRFSIRDVLLIMLIVGLAVGWLVDHRRLADELQRQRNQSSFVWAGNAVPAGNPWNTLQLLNTPTQGLPTLLQADGTIALQPPESPFP